MNATNTELIIAAYQAEVKALKTERDELRKLVDDAAAILQDTVGCEGVAKPWFAKVGEREGRAEPAA